MDRRLSMATSIGYLIPVSQARLKLRSESATDSTGNWSSSTSADPGCMLISLRSVSYVWRYPARAWKRRMHMNTSLLLVRFATVLIFSIWACWQNKHKLSLYLYVLGLYWYVPMMNEYIQEHYLWSLTRCVIWVSPRHDLTDLVQNAVSLLKIPLSLFACLVWQVLL